MQRHIIFRIIFIVPMLAFFSMSCDFIRKSIVWLVFVVVLITSCAAPNKMSMKASSLNKKILTDKNYYYHQGRSYKYDTKGVALIDSLTQDIPEAKIDIEGYHKKNTEATLWKVTGLGLSLMGIFFDRNKSESTTYEERESKNNSYLIGYIGGCFGMIMGAVEKEKANDHLKKAIMYYNSSLSDTDYEITNIVDVVHLKSGAEFKGEIIENITGKHIKLKLPDRVILTINHEQIEKIETLIQRQNVQEIKDESKNKTKESPEPLDPSETKDILKKPNVLKYNYYLRRFHGALKINVDVNGKHELSVLSLKQRDTTDPGITINPEIFTSINRFIELGLGIEFQLPRTVQNYDGNFRFMPTYALLKIHPPIDNSAPYLISRIGYNSFYADSDYKSGGSLQGGIHYGYGAGIILKRFLQIEVLYSVNNGKFEYWEWTKDVDIRYSKYNISMGFIF